MTLRLRIILLLLICISGVGLRLIHFEDVFTLNGVEFQGNDSYYHVKRSVAMDETFPMVKIFDENMNYPKGTYLLPGGYSFATVALIKVLGQSGNINFIKSFCAVFPILLYILGFLIICKISGKNYFFLIKDEKKGLKRFLSCVFFTIIPPVVMLTTLGKYDYHILETLFFALTLYMALSLSEDENISKANIYGFILGIMPFFWAQGVLFLFLFAIAGAFAGRAIFVLSGLAALGTYMVLIVIFGDLNSTDPNLFSRAQPLLACLSLWITLIGIIIRKRNIGIVLLFIVSFLPAYFYYEDLLSIFKIATDTLFAVNPFIASATESRGMTLSYLWKVNFEYSFALLPAVIISFFVIKSRVDNKISLKSFIPAGFLIAAIVFSVLQTRFTTFLSAIAVLIIPEFAIIFAERLKDYLKKWPYLAAVACSLILFIPYNMFDFSPISNAKTHPAFDSFSEACIFLRNYDKNTSEKKFGVLAKWDYGYWVNYYCRMPAVITPLTSPEGAAGDYIEATKIFYMTDMTKVKSELKSRNVKYVISLLPSDKFQPLANLIGLKEKYMSFADGYWVYEKPIFDTFSGRLSFPKKDDLPDWIKIIYVSAKKLKIKQRELPLIVIAEINYE